MLHRREQVDVRQEIGESRLMLDRREQVDVRQETAG